MIVLGIDPGLHGALVFYDTDRPFPVLDIQDIPTIKDKRGHRIDGYALSRLIDARRPAPNIVFLEEQAPRPGNGASQAAKAQRGYGQIEGILQANFLRIEYVQPGVWKKAVGCIAAKKDATYPERKELSRAKAITNWPGLSGHFARKMDADRAEAALIALYGVQQIQAGKVTL